MKCLSTGNSLFTAYHGEILVVDAEMNSALAHLFPEVDRPSEYRSADAWLMVAPPSRRPRNMKRFLVRWFSRAKRWELARPDDTVIIDGAKCRLTSRDRRMAQ
jgi:hypothetical protein